MSKTNQKTHKVSTPVVIQAKELELAINLGSTLTPKVLKELKNQLNKIIKSL